MRFASLLRHPTLLERGICKMPRFLNNSADKLAIAAGIAMAVLSGATQARADIVLNLQEDNGTVVQVTSLNNQGPVTFSGTVGLSGSGGGDFNIFIAVGSSNSPG